MKNDFESVVIKCAVLALIVFTFLLLLRYTLHLYGLFPITEYNTCLYSQNKVISK